MIRKPRSMRSRLCVESLEERLCPSSGAPLAALALPDAATQTQVAKAYGQLPLAFEANQGQIDAPVNFLSRGNGYSLFLTPTQAVLDLSGPMAHPSSGSGSSELTMQLVGSNPTAQSMGLEQLPGVSNYLLGADPSQWHTNVPHYGQVAYQNVYPGIDLVYYGNNQQHLEYDFVLAPGTNPSAIHLSFQGTQGITLDAQGNLVLKIAGGDVVEQAPVVYQTISGVRQAVSGRYIIEDGNQIGFQVGSYDATRPLVIDPTYSLVYSTYLGGSGGSPAFAIAVDSAGNAYVTGDTANGFPTKNPFQKSSGGNADAFVTKLNASGTALIYSTYLGGRYNDIATGIAVDSAGNAYVTGRTASANFPTKNAFQQTNHGGQYGWDAFLTKLNASGSALLYSTYLGGSADETSKNGIAVDNSGNAFVTGYTAATDFPTTPGAYQTTLAGNSDNGFVTKLNTTLSGTQSLAYSTYLGILPIFSIAVDGDGNAYVPSGNANLAPGYSVTKLNPSGSAVVYSTPMSPYDLQAIAVDNAGDAYATGTGYRAVFVTKLDPSGSQLYSFTFGGGGNNGNDVGLAIAVDGAGHAYVTGIANSSNIPQVNAFQAPPTTLNNQSAAFVTQLDTSLSGAASIIYSSYLGGNNTTEGHGIAVDGGGNAYVTGYSYGDFPTTPGAFETTYPYHGQHPVAVAFVTKIDPPADIVSSSTSDSAPAPMVGSASIPAFSTLAHPGEIGMDKRELAALLIGQGKGASPMPRTPILGSSDRPNRIELASVRMSKPEEAAQRLSDALVHPRAPLTSLEVLDAVFARGDWFPDPFMANLV